MHRDLELLRRDLVGVVHPLRGSRAATGAIGIAAGVGNAVGLLASLSAGWIAGRLGVGRTIIGSACLGGLAALPLLFATPGSGFAMLALASAAANVTGQIYNITQVSLRQAIVRHGIQGRMNATMRFLVWGTMPLGGLVGGALGEVTSLRAAIAVGVAGSALSFLWVLLSPVRALERVPEPAD